MLIPVLLTGGSGSRLWPLSRQSHPKQFLDLTGQGSLLEETARRMFALPEVEDLIAVSGESLRFVVAKQLRRANSEPSLVLLEPEGRNTAPAIALAALQVARTHGADATLLITPSDHLIADQAAFSTAVTKACAAAAGGALVTFGVVPDRAETGFGYLRAAAGVGERELQQFVEKPDLETAIRYLESGDYYWNSGMFVFQAGACLAALRHHAPDILDHCEAALDGAEIDGQFIRVAAEPFLACRNQSIDYAVMEKISGGVVVPLDAGWNDVGSWQFLSQTRLADAQGNRLIGDVIAQDTRDTTVYARDRLVATVGLKDCVVVETKDAVLVAAADRVQDIRGVVSALKEAGRQEVIDHPRVYRPWGSYETVDEGERFQVKRIIVTPGAKLSMQMHHHRAEHWTVVKGTARVTRGEETFMLTEDQSTYIPIGERHRLENPGAIPLELIEVQTGSYLGEDDIVRFDDDYGR